MAQTAQPTVLMTPAQYAALSPQQRSAYLQSLHPDDQAAMQAGYGQYVEEANAHFMALGLKKKAVCPPVGGGTTAAYSAGAALTYDFPTAGGAYASALIITCLLTVACAAGTGGAYALNQGAPLTVIDNIQVILNGTQHSLRPYMLKYFKQLTGYQKSAEPLSVLAGQKSTKVEANLNNAGTYPVATGNNTWNFKFRLPFNAIAPSNPAGLLPMQAAGTKPQVIITCAPAAMGNDPILNPVRTTAGTGVSVTITGTIQVDVEYRDGTNLWQPQALSLDLTDKPTVQYVRDQVLTNIVSGQVNRGRITSMLQHYLLLLVVVDATTAGQFISNEDNLQIVEFDMDSVGQNKFWFFGTGSNVSVYDYYEELRQQFGQDLDPGILPFVNGWSLGITNPDNRDGAQVLNMQVGGWTDVNYAIQLGSVGGASGVNARIEPYLISLNPQGLKLVQL